MMSFRNAYAIYKIYAVRYVNKFVYKYRADHFISITK